MDTVEIACSECGHMLRVSKYYLGSEGRCNHCGNMIEIAFPPLAEDSVPEYIDRVIRSASTPYSLLEGVLRAFSSVRFHAHCGLRATWSIAFLADHKANGLRLLCSLGCSSPAFLKEESFVPFGQCLCGLTASLGQMTMSRCYLKDPRRERRWLGIRGRGFYAIPLKSGESLLGVIALCVSQDGTPEHVPLLTRIGLEVGRRLQVLQRSQASEKDGSLGIPLDDALPVGCEAIQHSVVSGGERGNADAASSGAASALSTR